MLKFKQFVTHLDEVRNNMVSGTKAGWTSELDHRKYELKKDVKGARIRDYINVVLPKGTIIYNLPGGVLANHPTLKDKYCTGWGAVRWDNKYGVLITQLPEVLAEIEKNSKVLESVEFIMEGGNAVEDSRPLTQKEVIETYKWVETNVFPKLGLEGSGTDASPIGSYAKKNDDVTSSDIDIAVSVDKLAGVNGISIEDVLIWLNDKLQSLGYSTKMAKGFEQVSFGAPINGDPKLGTAQIDLMLSTNLDWSKFMYYSPNFKEAESKYKGMYRNVLMMSIVSEMFKEATKTTDKGEVEQYKQYVIRLEKGIYQVEKTFMGKKGSLVKTATLLHDQDKFITSTPEEVVELAFGKGIKPAEVMTFENAWSIFQSPNFPHSKRRDDILARFKTYILSAKMPVPSEVEAEYPNLF